MVKYHVVKEFASFSVRLVPVVSGMARAPAWHRPAQAPVQR